MAINNKRLGNTYLAATNTWYTVCTCATSKSNFVRSIVVNNIVDSPGDFSLAVTQTATPEDSEYVTYQYDLDTTLTSVLKLGIGMSAGDMLKIKTDTDAGNITAGAYGSEFDGIAESVKELAATRISADIYTEIYRAPAGTKTTVSTINICNPTASGQTIILAHTTNAATAIASSEFLAYGQEIGAYGFIPYQFSISMEASEAIIANPATSDLVIMMWGSEVS